MSATRPSRVIRWTLAALSLVAAVLTLSVSRAEANTGHGHEHGEEGGALFVSSSGDPNNSGSSCDDASYSSIQTAIDNAPEGATVVVCGGTYTENVVIKTPLTLRGESATIKGASTNSEQCDQAGPPGTPTQASCLAAVTIKSSDVTVEGFTVQDAIGEGILATGSLAGGSISDVKIERNTVVHNNLGGIPPTPNSPYPQCSAQGQIPGDCGEGIHLMAVANSRVSNNYVSDNQGGVLLTDEFGPTHDNVVEGNVVTKNPFDCGITVPGHNPMAVDPDGTRHPDVAGVYHNLIRRNTVTDNGLQGEGAGVLFANAGPGTGSYENVVEGNYLAGNELSGVTMHAHTLPPNTFEDLNGNKVIGNIIGRNNLGSPNPQIGPGDSLDGGKAKDPDTTGVLVFSATVPVDVTIAHNRILDNTIGIWLGVNGNVHATLQGNSFHNVTTPVYTFTGPDM